MGVELHDKVGIHLPHWRWFEHSSNPYWRGFSEPVPTEGCGSVTTWPWLPTT